MVRRRDCIGAPERLDEEGRAIEPLDREALRATLLEAVPEDDGVAVAVCYLFSYLNPEHELQTRELLAELRPGVPVSLSHEVAPIWREYERGTTTTVDAYLKPLIQGYVGGLDQALAAQGSQASWSLLKSNGGHALASEASGHPAGLLLSGIAGGAIGGAWFTRAGGATDGVALDMGGTSCDVCLVLDGEPLYGSDFEIEFGLPVSVPSVSTRTIGAGGGSIGWVDPGGFLQVGPQSAGADPGPACYGRGGEEATITDANVALGRLDPGYFLGGRLPLDASLAEAALDRLGDALGPRSRRGGLGDAARHQREHGERDPHRHRRAGHRPPRARAGRVRRRRADARRGDRRRDGHAARARAAEPGRLLGVRHPRRAAAGRRGAQRLPRRTSAPRRRRSAASSTRSRRARARRSRPRAARARSRRCGARSRCATRARTTSRRWRCRPAR